MDKGKTIGQIAEGEVFKATTKITDEMVRHFAEATGDFNPLHLDDDFAKGTVFKKRVAHGMLTLGLVSSVFGTKFPGLGTIYLSQNVEFTRPVFLGDEITVRIKVLELMGEKNRMKAETLCFNQDGKQVMRGEAVVMPPA